MASCVIQCTLYFQDSNELCLARTANKSMLATTEIPLGGAIISIFTLDDTAAAMQSLDFLKSVAETKFMIHLILIKIHTRVYM